MSIWKEYKFSDFVSINPSVKLKKGELYSFVEMKDLNDGQKFCEPSTERELSGGSRFKNGDTLFARITPCLENGKICQVRNLKNNIGFGSTEFLVFHEKEGVSDSDFIFYLSRHDSVRDFAEMNLDGTSGRQRVPKEAFDNLILRLPNLEEQKAIASILSNIDTKIDLLSKNKYAYEDLATCLFRQWFEVESDDTWEISTVDKAVTVKGGTTPSTVRADFWNGNINWTSPKDLSQKKSIFLFDTERKISVKGLQEIGSGLLPIGTVLLSSRAPIGYMAITEIPVAINQGYIAILCDKGISNFYIYLWVKRNLDLIIGSSNGSTFDEISKSVFKELEFVIPPTNKLESFNKLIEPIFIKIRNNEKQMMNLQVLRDTYLSKLISGEIKIKM